MLILFLIDHLYIEGHLYQPTLKKGNSCGSSVILAFMYKALIFFPLFFFLSEFHWELQRDEFRYRSYYSISKETIGNGN